jgi:hypothetical protein
LGGVYPGLPTVPPVGVKEAPMRWLVRLNLLRCHDQVNWRPELPQCPVQQIIIHI